MKKTTGTLFAALLFFGLFACHDDDNNSSTSPNVAQITASYIASGNWRITLFQEDDNIETSDFTGYNFVFASDHTITTSNGTNTYAGAWSITGDDSGSGDFNILFSNPSAFESLTEDWTVIESTPTKIRLRHTSGGDGGIDFLTFERNP